MSSLILSTATRILMGLMLLFSIFILVRGHDEPGGGFVGGLVAAAAFILYTLAEGVERARAVLRVDSRSLIGAGLVAAAGGGAVGLPAGRPFLTGIWVRFAGADVGTPALFDIGVYLVVMGVALTITFALAEE